ncbi:MAG: RusA family crossover junction endodeoxyribonuclease [Gemmatimonadetes bacterium]|nr:RusA family crossover junction endodeoxyribonuclease [Gemmatimonadota bacterium]
MESYEFIVPGRAISMRTANRTAFRKWIDSIVVGAIEAAPRIPVFWDATVGLSITFFCERAEIDVDNILKPIMDALTMIFYPDDSYVTDVDCHRRESRDKLSRRAVPELLQKALVEHHECTYIQVQNTRRVEKSPW